MMNPVSGFQFTPELGRRLRQLRLKSGFNQEDVALTHGVTTYDIIAVYSHNGKVGLDIRPGVSIYRSGCCPGYCLP